MSMSGVFHVFVGVSFTFVFARSLFPFVRALSPFLCFSLSFFSVSLSLARPIIIPISSPIIGIIPMNRHVASEGKRKL